MYVQWMNNTEYTFIAKLSFSESSARDLMNPIEIKQAVRLLFEEWENIKKEILWHKYRKESSKVAITQKEKAKNNLDVL